MPTLQGLGSNQLSHEFALTVYAKLLNLTISPEWLHCFPYIWGVRLCILVTSRNFIFCYIMSQYTSILSARDIRRIYLNFLRENPRWDKTVFSLKNTSRWVRSVRPETTLVPRVPPYSPTAARSAGLAVTSLTPPDWKGAGRKKEERSLAPDVWLILSVNC